MGAMSFWHFILIMVVLLVFFGPSRLPGLGKSMGEAIRGFKKGLNDDSIDVTDMSQQAQIKSERTNEQIRQGSETTNQSQRQKAKDEA